MIDSCLNRVLLLSDAMGLFWHWYKDTFNEMTGRISIPVETAICNFETYDEREAVFKAEQLPF